MYYMNAIRNKLAPLIPRNWQEIIGKVYRSDLAKKISRGIAWTFFSTVVYRGLIFFTSIIVARILNKEGFGELGMVRSTIDMFVIFSSFSLGLTTTRYVAENKVTDKIKAGRIIKLASGLSWIFGITVGGLMFLFSDQLAEQSLHASYLSDELKLSALAIILNAINGTQNGTLAGFEAFKNMARVNLLATGINFPISIFLAWQLGVKGAVLGLVLNGLFSSVLGAIEVRRVARKFGVNIYEKGSRSEARVLLHFSLPAVLGNSLILPVNWACNTILARQPEGFKELGIYNAGLSILVMVNVINGMLGQVLLPYAVANFKEKNRKFEMLNNQLPWAIGIFIALAFMLIPELGELLFGKDFSGPVLRATIVLVMLSTIITSYRQGINRNFSASGYMWWSFLGNGLMGAATLAFMYLWKDYGAIGRAGCYAIAIAFSTVVFIPLYLKKGLCDRGYLASAESLAIWSIIFIAFVIAFWTHIPSIMARICILLLLLGGINYLFIRYFKKYVLQ